MVTSQSCKQSARHAAGEQSVSELTSASSSARRISRMGSFMLSFVSLPSFRTRSHALSKFLLKSSNIAARTTCEGLHRWPCTAYTGLDSAEPACVQQSKTMCSAGKRVRRANFQYLSAYRRLPCSQAGQGTLQKMTMCGRTAQILQAKGAVRGTSACKPMVAMTADAR